MNWAERDFHSLLHPFSTYDAATRNLVITGARGAVLTDESGKSYIDAVSSWWVNLHGHAHPDINAAVKAQLNELEHVMFAGFTHEPAIRLAEKLLSIMPGNLSKVFLSDNGSTSVEVALKMAIQYHKNRNQKRTRFIAFQNAYHGDTFGAMSVSERDVFVAPFLENLFDVIYVPIPVEKNMEDFRAILESHSDIAGFIFEPLVQGAGGMRMYQAKWLNELMGMCKSYEVLCIADEVMTGFGRTGRYFASDYLTHHPDIICLSKGITGGYFPLGATAVSAQVMKEFKVGDSSHTFYHGHSFTGNPLSCAAANASISLLESEQCKEQIKFISEINAEFVSTLKKNPHFENPRTLGTIVAADFKVEESGYFYTHPIKEKLRKYFLDHGVVMRPLGNVVYSIPPYCISREQLEHVFETWINFKP